VIALDRDPSAQARAEGVREEFAGRFALIDRDFGRLRGKSRRRASTAFFRSRVSSFQFDAVERGFSFRTDGARRHAHGSRGPALPAGRWLETPPRKCWSGRFATTARETNCARGSSKALLAARRSGALARRPRWPRRSPRPIPARARHTAKIHPATRASRAPASRSTHELGALERALPWRSRKLASGGRALA